MARRHQEGGRGKKKERKEGKEGKKGGKEAEGREKKKGKRTGIQRWADGNGGERAVDGGWRRN